MIQPGINTRTGPICRTVEDAARILDVIAGYDPKDELTVFSVGRKPAQPYYEYAREQRLDGMKIGVVRELFDKAELDEASHQTIDLVERAVEDLRKLGATIVDPGPDGALLKACTRKYAPKLAGKLFTDMYSEQFPVDKDGKPRGDHVAKLVEMVMDPSKVPEPFSFMSLPRGSAEGESKFMMNLYLAERGDAQITSNTDLFQKANFYTDPKYPDRKAARENTDKPQRMDMADRMLDRFTTQTVVLQCMEEMGLHAMTYPSSNDPPEKLDAPSRFGRALFGPTGRGSSSSLGRQGFPAITVPAGFTIVAAGGAAFDIGSDWGGSIRGPAHNNGIAGIKPTSVRVPRTGHIVDYGGVFDLWQQLGPMTRRVEDLILITPIISGPDYRDVSCAPVPWADPAKVDLKKLRVAYCADNGATGQAATDEDTKKTVRQVAKWLEGATASVKEDVPQQILLELTAARTKLTSGDAWQFYQRLADRFGSKNFSPSVKERMKSMTPIKSAEYVEAWELQDLGKSRMLEWMTSYDIFICPVAGKPAQPIDAEPGAGGFGGPGNTWQYTGVFNSTGWPSTVVRCGSSADGKLPIGVQVIAAPWRDDLTLAVASFLESKSGGWQKPPI